MTQFSTSAASVLEGLRQDPDAVELRDAVDNAVVVAENADPDGDHLPPFLTPEGEPSWGVLIPHGDTPWVLLWRWGHDDEIFVEHIGPRLSVGPEPD
jgi:hypothetical protein